MITTLWTASNLYTHTANAGAGRRRVKFLLRALLQWPYSKRWFHYLSSHPELAAALPHQPQWLHKLQRPYVCTDFDCATKLRVLQQHFSIFLTQLPATLIFQLLRVPSVVVATIEGKSQARYRIELSLTRIMDKEGELMLTLVPEATQERLVTLAFSFSKDDAGQCQVLLGCLQGPQASGGRERFREVTKDLHGLMPKTLLVKALCALSLQLGMNKVLAISNRGHVHNSHWRGYHAISSDYDALWITMGGVASSENFFQIPSWQPERNLAAVASNKRAQYQRRQALEAGIAAQLTTLLSQSKPCSATRSLPRVGTLACGPRYKDPLPSHRVNLDVATQH